MKSSTSKKKLRISSNKSNKEVLVLDQSYQPITLTSMKKCINLLYRDKIDVVEYHVSENINSPSDSIRRPIVIRLRSRIPYNPYKFVNLSRVNVMRRDGHTCVYCGSKNNLTIDHMIPKSRGGRDEWENLVTACGECNFVKDDRTPEEWGIMPSHRPRRPSHISFMLTQYAIPDQWRPYLFCG
jgi:5-methylcytosine-specific restriction endonuclease McrA